MQVYSIDAKKFMGFTGHVFVEFSAGLTLITGANGAGKSSLVEAVAFAGWGETLRKASPQIDDSPGIVVVREGRQPTSGIARSFDKAGKRRLVFLGSEKYETLTKAQAALERDNVGSFSMWRRTCLFSSDDVGRFTDATDAERKRFLEQVTDPEQKLEAASEKVRVQLRNVERKIQGIEGTLRTLDERTEGLQLRIKEARTSADQAKPAGSSKKTEAALVKLREEESILLEARQELLDQAQTSVGEKTRLEVEWEHVQAHAKTLQSSACATCGRPISKKEAALARKEAFRIAGEMQPKLEAVSKRVTTIADSVDQLREELRTCQQKITSLSALLGHLKAADTEHAKRSTYLKQLVGECENANDCADTERALLQALTSEQVVLKMVDNILGTRGVRSFLLEHVLGLIEQDANEWLLHLSGEHEPMAIELKPYTEKVGGGLQDVIALKVDWGGGSYESASRGERRRIDVAVMLALAGLKVVPDPIASTLWFDETMDALDDAAVDAACRVLEELAQRRPVVVISHNAGIIRKLNYDKHYEVVDGTIQQIK